MLETKLFFSIATDHESRYLYLSAKENDMSDLSMSMFLNKDDLEKARQEALIASRVKASAVVTKMQQSGTHWTLTAKPEKAK
jgi:hypothetical protein